jgi:hypothetical protein
MDKFYFIKYILALSILFVIGSSCSDSDKSTTDKNRIVYPNPNEQTQSPYQQGLQYFNDEKYNDAEWKLSQVKENDSNYADAQQKIKICENKIKIADQKFNNSKAGKIYKFCQSKNANVSKEDCERAAEGKIWIGMNIWLLVAKRGKPNAVNPSNYGSGTEYQYCWENWSPSCFYTKEDDIVYSYN